MSSAATGKIASGTQCIKNLGCRPATDSSQQSERPAETWCQVEAGNVKGWAPTKYLAEAACQNQPKPPNQISLDKAGRARVVGELHGDKDAVYRIVTGAGQRLTIDLEASNPQAYFKVSAPGSRPVAMFNGSTGGKFAGVLLPDGGDYEVTIYLMRAAARRGERSKFTLSIRLDGEALKPIPASQDALVTGTRFHATATIPCTPPFGFKVPCDAGVVRHGIDGIATVDIAIGKDLRRRILFVAGTPVASDAAGEMKSVHDRDVTVVTIDDESFSIPDPLVGGD